MGPVATMGGVDREMASSSAWTCELVPLGPTVVTENHAEGLASSLTGTGVVAAVPDAGGGVTQMNGSLSDVLAEIDEDEGEPRGWGAQA